MRNLVKFLPALMIENSRTLRWATAGSRVAAARGQADVALAKSEKALAIWASKTGFSTARMEPRLQRMRADALAVAGRIEEAQANEDAAWRSSQKFDGPANPTAQRRIVKKI